MRLTAVFLAAAACFPLTVRGAAVLEGELIEKLAEAGPDELIHVNIVMADRVNPEELLAAVDGFPKEAAREYVVRTLKAKADATQPDLRAYLDTAVSEGSADDVRYIWLNNTVGLFAKPGLIEDLALRNDIERINWDPARVTLFQSSDGPGAKGTTWNVDRVGAPEAWDAGYTGEGAIVAILDSGCDYEHPDLANQAWTNPGEIPDNDEDDDGNGYVDDVYGWNFRDDNNEVQGPVGTQGHGTMVAGIIAGDGTMGTQTGVAPDAKFMTCVIASPGDPGAYQSTVWDAMEYATDNGAHIINLSSGLYHDQGPDRAAWREICENLIASGMVLVFAAGNAGNLGFPEPPDEVGTPADVPCVIAVGATDSNDERWVEAYEGSSRGPVTWKNVPPYNDYPYPPGLIKPGVAALGADITTTQRTLVGDWYIGDGPGEEPSGTSFAAPHAAGLAALILDADPSLTHREVFWSIVETADDLDPPGKDNEFGWGLIQCLDAIDYALDGDFPEIWCPTMEPPGTNGE